MINHKIRRSVRVRALYSCVKESPFVVPLTVGMWISSVGGSLVVPLIVDMSFSSTARSSVGIVSLLVPWLGVSDLIHQMGLVMASFWKIL